MCCQLQSHTVTLFQGVCALYFTLFQGVSGKTFILCSGLLLIGVYPLTRARRVRR